MRLSLLCLAIGAGVVASGASAALLDGWRAEDLSSLNNGDAVGTWSSASNRIANASPGLQPTLIKDATPAGGAVVRFNRHWMTVGNSPVGGRSAFSIAVVFRPALAGANDNAQWYGKTGLIDAEQGGITTDWGTVLDQAGQVGIGTGSPDVSTYSSGASLVGSNYHAAVFTWGGGSQAVYVDGRPAVTAAGVSGGPRNSAGLSFGGIHTGEGGANRRLVGDLVEIRFYDTALTALQASNVIHELTQTHLVGNLPRIRSFTANTNRIYLGRSATLSWQVTNATSVAIDQGVGSVAASGSLEVSPTMTTTYTLTATNLNGLRTASLTVTVDPGVPIAFNLTTNTPYNTPLSLLLSGWDPQGSNLTYAIVTPPSHGTLSGSPPAVTYAPSNNFAGLDSFTFAVNDGTFDSAPGTVSIAVVPPPTAPSGIVLSSTNIPAGTVPGGFVAALRAIDVNTPYGDTHTFALVPGFGDNARFALGGNVLSAGPTFSGGPGSSFTVRLRVTDSTSLTFEQTFGLTVVEVRPTVVINEIHHNSPLNTIREEFIELSNPTDAPVDLSQWRLRAGVDFNFPANTVLAPHSFLVVADDPATIAGRYGVTALGPWSGRLNNDGEEITLRDAANNVIDRVDFRSEFPWPVAANGDGASMQLVNAALDNDLGSSWRSGTPPTPGATNRVFATNAAPNIRQVQHTPRRPASGNPVLITARVTDPEGVASVALAYQVVAPGQFVPATLPLSAAELNSLNTNPALTNSLNPAFEAPTNWIAVAMHDDGSNGDAVAGDATFSVILPQQANRALIRYRITVTDSLGASRRAPFEDDPSLNFACFVHDGIPDYAGVSSATLQTLPVYTLITRDADLNECTAWFSPWSGTHQLPQGIGGLRNEGRLYFNWEGAVVYDGQVYDHVTYRLRGANGRYHNGKRSFRIRFKNGRYLEAKDNQGNRFPTKWRELTTGKGQSNRGTESFALNEVVNYFLWNKVGVPSPWTVFFHFRVVRGAQESPADLYAGDFWGLNWAQEKYDVNFLDSHQLAKGNLYKLVDNYVLGVDERRYQAALAATNAEDFFNIENNLNGYQSVDWLNAQANYTNWYRYFAVAKAIRHYDVWPSANKNGAWYFEPIYGPSNNYYGRMMQLPYDSTDTWGPTWNNGDDILYDGIFPSSASGGDAGQHPEMQLEYRNVVREVRALLFQPDQINALIDAHAGVISRFAPADYARWRSAPSPASYNSIQIPNSPGVTGGLPGYVQDMKNFMFVGGNNSWWTDRTSVGAGGWVTILDSESADPSVPQTPTLTYAGSNGAPVDGLVFRSSAFADPEGLGTFAAMQWRIAEVLAPGTAVTNPRDLKLEWDAAWASPELPVFNEFITIPPSAIQIDHLYRVRVRHQDNTGRWSRWSAPFEFRPGPADLIRALRGNLVFSEIMYHPPGLDIFEGDEFEFLELKNIGPATLDLSGLFFSDGISFTFTNGTRLAPGQPFLLARNPALLPLRYPGVVVNGTYGGRLDDGGEALTISHPHGGVIVSVTYDDRGPWPVTADGFGFSLVLGDPAEGTYRASAQIFGTPGTSGAASALGGVVVNEVLSSSSVSLVDMIELRNTTAVDLNVGGWFLSDDPTYPWKYRIPDGTLVAAGSYRVFDESQFNPTPGLGTSFSLSSLGDEVYLFSAGASNQLTGYSHGFSFGGAQDGVSLGRYLNSVGEEFLPLQFHRTFTNDNSGPRVGPVVISEIHYHPAATNDEFIELQNLGGAIALYDEAHPTNRWQLNGAAFTFPSNIWLAAQGYLLLVNDDPAQFRARHPVPAGVEIFHFGGALQNRGENLELLRPDLPATNGVPYYALDAVRYHDRPPWPRAADGAGASLQRVVPGDFGSEPTNWIAAIPTPGLAAMGGAPPSIISQPQSFQAVAFQSYALSVDAVGSGPLQYQWRFNGDHLDGATNAVLAFPNIQPSQGGLYTVLIFNGAGSTESSNAVVTVRRPANIVANPTNIAVFIQPDPRAAETTNATFSISASTFNPPLAYQWRFNGTNLAGATGSSHTVTNVQLVHEGWYDVVVTDAIGPALSAPVRLTPLITPVITQAPLAQSVAVSSPVTLSVEATGNPLPFTFEWRRGSIVLMTNLLNRRHDFFTLTVPGTPGSQQYRVVIKNQAMPNPGIASSLVTVTSLADAEGDGMPDAWENSFGLNPTNSLDRDLDFDADGASNWQEYVAGTDPTNAASSLFVSLDRVAGHARVSFAATSNHTYSVQSTDSLGRNWSSMADVVARSTNRLEQLLEPAWATNRFYRVVTPAQP